MAPSLGILGSAGCIFSPGLPGISFPDSTAGCPATPGFGGRTCLGFSLRSLGGNLTSDAGLSTWFTGTILLVTFGDTTLV